MREYRNGVGPPVLNGSLGAMILGRMGSGGGINSWVLIMLKSSLKYQNWELCTFHGGVGA